MSGSGGGPLVAMDLPYKVGFTEKVRHLEEELNRDLIELKNEIEENEMIHGIHRPVSSVILPKDITYFQRERDLVIRRAMEVCEAKPLLIQADLMTEELSTASKTDYKPDGLPLLIHQFFLDRMHELVQCKHMHMLRWKRFCEHTSTIEALYPYYQKRLTHIMAEYNDCLQRCNRLALARESYLSGAIHTASQALKLDDLMIYLRWMVCHFHSIKKFNQYMRVLQWLPTVHKEDLAPTKQDVSEEDDQLNSTRIPDRYREDFLSKNKSDSSTPVSAVSSGRSASGSVPPTPPPFNPMVLTTNPLPASQFAYAAAASGGGLASDERSLRLPLHVNDLESLRPQLNFLAHLYSITVDVEELVSSADEMELYATVTRNFRQIFTRQEHMRTFKTYDKVEIGQENWGSDHSMHALKYEANWLPFVQLRGEKNPFHEKKMVELRSKNKIDELLRVKSKFLNVTEPEKVQEALRDMAIAVREPLITQPVSVQSHKTSYHTSQVWKRIFTKPSLYTEEKDDKDIAIQELEEKDTDNVNFSARQSRISSGRRRRDSYDYVDTVQLLGLDEGEQDSNDPASIQGAYLSFLQLRHLRIKDLMRTCLSILNYFRSIQRTLTINDGGLSLDSGKLKRHSAQNHRRNTVDGTTGGGGGIGSHQYMHNTPKDFKISETEFMEFADIDNHDDFYMLDEGRVHVQDQRGYYIVYDVAMEDLKKMEHDLLLIGTHYIEKDRDLRQESGIPRSHSSRGRTNMGAGDFAIGSYGHQEVDRFGILLDLWSNQTAFLETKKELVDCYMEAYLHVYGRDEKRILAQAITTAMFRQPRMDFSADYFIQCFRLECICLRHEASLVKQILDTQIEDQREYVQKVCREGDADFGLPHKIVPKQPISVNMSRSALKNVYMLEFHPSLAIAGRIPEALKHAYWESYHMHKPGTVTEQLVLHKKLLEMALREWNSMEAMGSNYAPQVQKDLFSDVFVEDPLFVSEICHTLVSQQEQALSRKSQKEKQIGMAHTVGRLMEALTLRYRLMDSAWQCEILSKIYRKQAVEMGFDECHMFLRFVQFEFASHKPDAGKAPPIFITSIHDEDTSIDRFIPNHIYLGIHELDESHVGRFSFRSRDGVLQIMNDQGLESLQTVLMCQIVHKNSLMSAVQQATACQSNTVNTANAKGGRPTTPTETKSEKSAMTDRTAMSGATQMTGYGSSKTPSHKKGCSPEAFVSLQLEKSPSRDIMLNEFVSKKASMGLILKKPEEMEKLKRKLVIEYSYRLNQRIAQYSLRSQIISYYNSILRLLEDFPNIRDTYFLLGEPNEKKSENDTLKGLEADPRNLRKRPRRVISYDGKHVLNLWFVPHHLELLIMFKKLDDDNCKKALTYCLRIVSSLHDILQYLCAHARLGSSQARLGSQKIEFVSADWGGSEGLGADLREIQKQLDHLENKSDPDTVCQFLAMRRDVMFLEFDAAVRHSMRDTFLATKNVPAFQAISDCMHFALHELSNAQHPSLGAIYLNVPEPLEARDPDARMLYPWRSFINRNGPYPVHFWQWQQIEYHMQLCMAGLKDVDRHVANGEILGVSLLMEDVLTMGNQEKAINMATSDDEDEEDDLKGRAPSIMSGRGTPSSLTRPGSSLSKGSRPPSAMSAIMGRSKGCKKPLSKMEKPIEAYTLLKSFLLLWKRLEISKYFWGLHRLNVEDISTTSVYQAYCKEYRKEILYLVLSSVARRFGQSDRYEGMVSDNEPIVLPRGASEMEVRTRQLIKLLEYWECHMITELRKRFIKELNLVLSERAREESALPTDLWKRPVMRESYTINKPHIAEEFIDKLMSECKEMDGEVTFSKKHLNSCLQALGSDVMARERHNYDSYTMYYENLLRVHHQLLYQKEQEMKQVRDQLVKAKQEMETEVQCHLADENYDLLLEITALRAKIAEMRTTIMDHERDIRERVREEYDELVHNLFSSAFDLKRKFDEFREDLYESVNVKIAEARGESIEALDKLRQKSGQDQEEEESHRGLVQAQRYREVQHENHNLTRLMTKMKTINNWKQQWAKGANAKMLASLRKDADHSKKEYLKVKMMAEEEVILLRQQQVALRNALRISEQEASDAKRNLDLELKAKKEKQHAAQQSAQSQKQLEDARKDNIEKMFSELEDKEWKLRQMADEQDKNTKLQHLMQEKIKRDVTIIKRQLGQERNLKLDAFQRVDELQTQIYDSETPMVSRPHTVLTMAPSQSKSKSRLSSAPTRKRSSPTNTGIWPPLVTWPANRSVTPGGDYAGTPNNLGYDNKKIQRPKTTMGRLRSRVADQLLNDLDPPDHHETLIRLKELKEMQLKEKSTQNM